MQYGVIRQSSAMTPETPPATITPMPVAAEGEGESLAQQAQSRAQEAAAGCSVGANAASTLGVKWLHCQPEAEI